MKTLLSVPILASKALFYRVLAGNRNLPSRNFENFGRILGIKKKSLHLFLNPISSVRYYEFDFCYRNFLKENPKRILDISSPYLFGLYINKMHQTVYQYINPNSEEIKLMQRMAIGIVNTNSFNILDADSAKLPFENNYFDLLLLISVIEHIDSSIEDKAIQEMWRVLSPGGIMLLTLPSSKKYFEEFRDTNVYNLDVTINNDKYFFQRIYDEKAIQERILDRLKNHKVIAKEIYGEIRPNFFAEYEKRWLEQELNETVKDPYYMVKEIQKINSLNELTGNLAITCLAIRKMAD